MIWVRHLLTLGACGFRRSDVVLATTTNRVNSYLNSSLKAQLSALDQQIRKRAALATFGYSTGIAGSIGLYVLFSFPLCRVGSVILIIALTQMIWKVYEAGRETRPWKTERAKDPLLGEIGKVEAQIRLIQSLIYNLPFVVGANLFFMGLPGTGSAESKAWLDCFFLLGTVIVFGGCYFANQQTVRNQLVPLRQHLKTCLGQSAAPWSAPAAFRCSRVPLT
jgi:hypothetical protein